MPNNEEIKIKLDDFIKNSDIRENVINWYDFKKDANILFIGNDIYNCLFKNNNKVTILEKDAELFENIVSDNSFEKYNMDFISYVNQCTEKYDYIVIIDAMKRLDDFVNVKKKDKAITTFLNTASKILKKDGILLFPIENKFSIKNFSGATYNTSNSYDVLCGKERSTSICSKKEIIKYIEASDFKYYKFYYPFPDYKLPSIVYSDEYLPNENNSKLSYLIYYNPQDTIIFNEMDMLKEIVKDGMLDYFANSYILEISNSNNNFSKVKFASFNNFRKKENKLITKMYEDYVVKEPIYEEGKIHINQIEKNLKVLKKCNIDVADEIRDGKVYSKYQTLSTLNEVLAKYVLDEETDVAISIIEMWYTLINEKFMCEFCEKDNIIHNIFEKYSIIIDENLKEEMHFLKNGLFDFIFENIFVELDEENNFKKFVAYDQEWSEECVPIEFILYRALNNFFYYNSKIKKYISIETLYEKFNILQYIEIFKTLEAKIQESLIDRSISDMYEQTYVAITNIEGLNSVIACEKEKYSNLLSSVERTNEQWQQAVEKLTKENEKLKKSLKEYTDKSVISKIKNIFKQ